MGMIGSKLPKDARHSSPNRPKAPLPISIPGRYFLVTYRPHGDAYTITLDDPDKSSYDLGSDMSEIVRRFRRWGHEKLGSDAVDFAREYGGVQAIITGHRLRSLHRMKPPTRPNVFAQPERTSYALPSL